MIYKNTQYSRTTLTRDTEGAMESLRINGVSRYQAGWI